jgi:hypothetical protein
VGREASENSLTKSKLANSMMNREQQLERNSLKQKWVKLAIRYCRSVNGQNSNASNNDAPEILKINLESSCRERKFHNIPEKMELGKKEPEIGTTTILHTIASTPLSLCNFMFYFSGISFAH